MLTRFLFLIALLSGATVFLTGAWTGPFAPAPRSPEPGFVSQPAQTGADTIGSERNAKELLAKAIDKLGWNRTTWLSTKIRQTVKDTHSNFRADGVLLRGPRHCVRLEMKVVSKGVAGNLLIVSDGEVLAQVRSFASDAPEVGVEPLPAAGKDEYLDGKGCGGPLALLREFQRHLHQGTVQTGTLQGQAVIKIQGELPGQSAPGSATPVAFGRVYLDATTLWPCRLEWWAANQAMPIARVVYLEPEINRERSLQDCMKLFSYHPDGNPAP